MSQNQTKVAGKGDFFAKAIDRTYKTVPVPDVQPGMVIRLRSLTAAERADYEDDVRIKTKKGYDIDPTHLQEKLIIRTAVDEGGSLIFGEEDLPRLAGMPAQVITRLFQAAQELCGLGEAAQEAEERLKDAQS